MEQELQFETFTERASLSDVVGNAKTDAVAKLDKAKTDAVNTVDKVKTDAADKVN